MVGTDPVKEGLVASLNKPGGNATGIDLLINRLEAKKLGLFREMLPQATKFAILINPAFPPSRLESSEIMAAARILKIDVELFRASNADEIEAAFRSIAQQQFPGLIVGADTFFQTEFAAMSALSAQYELPVIAFDRAFPAVGGLMSYGIDLVDAHRQVGLYVGRILSGAKPADLPVTEPNKFELVIDVKTARSLDLTVPASLLAIADDVIE
jgi:putative ABC transport system substrate-binding protein